MGDSLSWKVNTGRLNTNSQQESKHKAHLEQSYSKCLTVWCEGSWLVGPLMSLPIRYSPMAFYFWLSIIFHALQVLWHLLHQRDLLRPSHKPLCDRYRLYPIPIAPLVRYHVGDLSYDLRTTSLHFPFLVFSPYLTHSFAVRPITDRRTARLGPYHMFCRTRTLCSFYLLFVFKTFVSTPKNKEVFLQNSDLSSLCLIVSLHSILAPLLYLVLPTPFTLSHRSKPPSCTTSHSLILRQETISLIQNHTPQNHIGFTLRSPISTDLCRILGTSPWEGTCWGY